MKTKTFSSLLRKPRHAIAAAAVLVAALASMAWNNASTTNSKLKADKLLLVNDARKRPDMRLWRKAYVVSYNDETLQPNWVAWQLTRKHAQGTAKRPGNAFHEDPEVPEPRATLADYRRSGYSRGHLCPAADNKWDAVAMYESFLLTNMSPQHPRLNSGDWNEIETACRRWAVKYGSVYIIAGPLFLNTRHKTIGPNRIPVPEAFFKVVLRLGKDPQGIGFVCRNTAGNRKKDQYVNSIDQIERLTGYDFFHHLNNKLEQQVESQADLQAWQ